MRLVNRLALVAGLAFAAVGSAASAQTLGELVTIGKLSQGAFAQLVANTGLSTGEARGLTLEDVVSIKWQDD